MTNSKLPQRKKIRLNNYDYSTPAAYFITICTLNRIALLSKVVGDGVFDVPHNSPQIELFECGKIAEKYLNQMNDFYKDISVDKYVIMPDHIHFILSVNGAYPFGMAETDGMSRTPDGMSRTPDGMSRTPSPTKTGKANSAVAKFVSTFKRFCHKEIGKPIFQRSYYDHIIRDQNDYNEKCEYIENNPTKRAIMKND